MKEIVDGILNGETVDIVGKAQFCLSVKAFRAINAFHVGFSMPSAIDEHSQVLDVNDIKKAGKALIDLAEALESRKKFKDGDDLFFVTPKGVVLYFSFDSKSATHLGFVMSGNAFKTRAEAEAHKEEILAKYQELRDKGLV